MTPTERQQEFKRLYNAIPGTNVERIRMVCEVLRYQPNTVRIYTMNRPTRIIPRRSIEILRAALRERGISA